jgi:nucleotide-binding universal stress UspA family protein
MDVILVPLDGSSFAEHALPVALGLARQTGARLELVCVHEGPAPAHHVGSPAANERLDSDIRGSLRRYLTRVRKRLDASVSGIAVEIGVLDGKPQDVLAQHARASGAELIVLTTHGRGGVSRSWLGSVAEGLVRRVPVPVLVVRAKRKRASLQPTEVFRHVVIAVDSTPESERIVPAVAALAPAQTAIWTLFHVILPLHPVVRAIAPKGAEELDAHEQQTRAKDYLKGAADRLRARGIEPRTAMGVDLQPARAITAFAAQSGADLIALATHGRGPIGRLVLGSVADKVLRTATVPVLLAHMETSEAAAFDNGVA